MLVLALCLVRRVPSTTTTTAVLNVVSDKPRFAADHRKEEYIWASKTRNVTCSADSEPAPTFDWQRSGQSLRSNRTFRLFTAGRVSNLQVRAATSATVAHLKPNSITLSRFELL